MAHDLPDIQGDKVGTDDTIAARVTSDNTLFLHNILKTGDVSRKLE